MSQIQKTGSLTILVPGTGWEGSGGWEADNPLIGFGNRVLGQNRSQGCTRVLRWSGRNGDQHRLQAAEELLELIAEHRFAAGDKLTVLTHSHGGNVALAASHRGMAHPIDNLITLNKPRLVANTYRAGENLGIFFNISANRDWIQWAGSNAKLSRNWSADPGAVNLTIDTSQSNLRPHGALIWDDRIREVWWAWLKDQLLIR
jgi:hypothetical protein